MSDMLKLPDGTYTKSMRLYLREWRALKKPIEDSLGMTTIGFDPGLLMAAKGKGGSVEMPLWFARRLSAAMKRLGPNEKLAGIAQEKQR